MSVKQMQSEVGVTGEPSPNVALMEQVTKILDKFEHDHENITCYDNFIIICGLKMGDKIYDKSGDDRGLAVMAQMCGCYEDIASSLCAFLYENESLMPVFAIALNEATQMLLNNPKTEEDGFEEII
jgi:hypothetical protein